MTKLTTLLVAAALASSGLHADSVGSVYFNVAGTSSYSGPSLAPSYSGAASSLVTSSALVGQGLNPSRSSDLGGPGNFVFDGWWIAEPNPNGYIGFDVTAIRPVVFGNLSFSFFSGLYNYRAGPHNLAVAASRDGFASDSTWLLTGWWNLYNTMPWISDSPNDFSIDVSHLGQLNPGQTMSFRFYPHSPDYPYIPAGFWKTSPNDFNPTLTIDAGVPEPTGVALMAAVAAALIFFRRRAART